MKPLNKRLWGRALDRAVPETYTHLSGEQLSKALDLYTELIVRECAKIADTAEPFKTSDLILQKFGIYDETLSVDE